MKLKLASQGVYWTIQGEGHFVGEPMVFIRLAGCSVGCPKCDTNYKPVREATVDEIAHFIQPHPSLSENFGEAVLALTGVEVPDPTATFYPTRGAGTAALENRTWIVLDNLRIGLVYAVVLEAFKLGS